MNTCVPNYSNKKDTKSCNKDEHETKSGQKKVEIGKGTLASNCATNQAKTVAEKAKRLSSGWRWRVKKLDQPVQNCQAKESKDEITRTKSQIACVFGGDAAEAAISSKPARMTKETKICVQEKTLQDNSATKTEQIGGETLAQKPEEKIEEKEKEETRAAVIIQPCGTLLVKHEAKTVPKAHVLTMVAITKKDVSKNKVKHEAKTGQASLVSKKKRTKRGGDFKVKSVQPRNKQRWRASAAAGSAPAVYHVVQRCVQQRQQHSSSSGVSNNSSSACWHMKQARCGYQRWRSMWLSRWWQARKKVRKKNSGGVFQERGCQLAKEDTAASTELRRRLHLFCMLKCLAKMSD